MARKPAEKTVAVRRYKKLGKRIELLQNRAAKEIMRLVCQKVALWKRMTEEQRKAADLDMWLRLQPHD